ncbi:MAG: alanine dehydrogenase [Bacteroidales bacterium]|nr:alanine dehydrogenase [Bacteroidales bacterium]
MVDQKRESIANPLRYTGMLPQEEMLEIGKKHKKLLIGLPKEDQQYEKRIGLTPEAVEVLVNNGHDVIIEKDAGVGARYVSTDYSEHGGFIVDSNEKIWNSDIILKVSPLTCKEIDKLKGNQVILSPLNLNQREPEYIKKLMAKKITAIAFENIKNEYDSKPIVQSMHAIAGSTSIIIAAEMLSNISGGKGVLLGGVTGITPTEVVILGAGTAAESATRAALGMGSFVKVFDSSVQKLEQLQNRLGVRLHTSIFHPQVFARHLLSADVLIGALDLHDTGARFFVTEEMVQKMKKGAVIIDLAIDQGGCIETSECHTLNDPVYTRHGVLHYSVANIPSRVSRTASIALSNILSPILLDLGSSGGIKPYLKADNSVRKGVYLYNGILTNERISDMYQIPFKDIDLLMAAF